MLIDRGQLDPYRVGPRMTDGVGQRFLRHPKQAQGEVWIDRAKIVGGAEGHLNGVAFFDLRAETAQGGDKARVLHHARMQFMRQGPDGLRQRRGSLLKVCDRVPDFAWRMQLANLVLEPAHHDAETGQLLADIIVQLARDARALLFLRVDQAAGQIAILFGGLPKLGFGAAPPDP